MKADLAKMSAYYDAIPTEQKRTEFPPLKGAFLVSEIYDELWPGWREIAMKPPIEITPERHEKIMQHLQPMLDAIKDLDNENH